MTKKSSATGVNPLQQSNCDVDKTQAIITEIVMWELKQLRIVMEEISKTQGYYAFVFSVVTGVIAAFLFTISSKL